MEKIDLKKLIAEAKEIAEALDEFAYKLEVLGIAKDSDEFADKYADKLVNPDEYLKHSDNGFPYFMDELTEDDLEKRQKTIVKYEESEDNNDKNNM